MSPEHFELLIAAQEIFAHVARDAEDMRYARVLLDAVAAGRKRADDVLLRNQGSTLAEKLRGGARLLRDTGSFVNADLLGRFATVLVGMERRRLARPDPGR